MEKRVQALTNLGNSYDIMGRDVDAIACYDAVLELDPRFGMALGNKGISLLHVAPFALAGNTGRHCCPKPWRRSTPRSRTRKASSIRYGGVRALEHFPERRSALKVSDDFKPHRHEHPEWDDPYLRWCAQHGLFLHVSLACLSEGYEELDPLFFRGVTVGLDDAEQRRANDLFDAFNSLKQDYLAARYLLWLADGAESPIREHAAATSARAGYLDTLRYARWGARTGLAIQAFAAASNVLDKVACAVHLYYQTPRKTRTVYFRYLWHPPHGKNQPDAMDPKLVDSAPTRGLLALCDLKVATSRRRRRSTNSWTAGTAQRIDSSPSTVCPAQPTNPAASGSSMSIGTTSSAAPSRYSGRHGPPSSTSLAR